MIKKLSIATVTFFVFVLFYLGTAYFWAYSPSETALKSYENKNNQKLQLTKAQVSMLLKIEDPSFWKNKGIDISHNGQGKTTMTQSVVPLLLYNTELSGWRANLQTVYSSLWPKFKKIDLGRDVMALAVSKKIHKDKILKIFAEQVYLGYLDNKPVFGISQASQKYFNQEVSKLSIEDFAGLVGMLKSPDHYSPINNKSAFNERKSRVLKVINGSCAPSGLFDTDYSSCS